MTPVERLQAAIDKLEQLRDAAEPVRHDSEWVVTHEVTETMRWITVLDSHNGGYDGGIIVEQVTSEARAQLIVTLHRTIDAQLLMLRTVLDAANIERNWDTLVYTEATLALADAILAGEK